MKRRTQNFGSCFRSLGDPYSRAEGAEDLPVPKALWARKPEGLSDVLQIRPGAAVEDEAHGLGALLAAALFAQFLWFCVALSGWAALRMQGEEPRTS